MTDEQNEYVKPETEFDKEAAETEITENLKLLKELVDEYQSNREWRKLTAERRLRIYEAKSLLFTQINNNVNNIALAATKSALIINGGATIALLAFLGNLVSIENPAIEPAMLARALFFFLFGIFAAALCFGFHYFNAFCFAGASSSQTRRFYTRWLNVWRWAAVVVGLTSLICFLVGGYIASAEFTKYSPTTRNQIPAAEWHLYLSTVPPLLCIYTSSS